MTWTTENLHRHSASKERKTALPRLSKRWPFLPRSPAGLLPYTTWSSQKDHTTPGMLNMNVKNQSVLLHLNGSASEQEREPVPLTQRLLSACYQHKKAITGMIISGLVLCSVFLGLRTLMSNCPSITCPSVTSPSGTCPSVTCPPDWIGHQRHCYKFSDKDKNWNESQNFCMSHNASLAKITEEEMDFVKKFTRDNVFWIGLKKELDQLWKWLDGENSTLEVMGNGGDCAYLDGGAKANSGRCTTEHHYICKKN